MNAATYFSTRWLLAGCSALLLVACASQVAAPDWQGNAYAALKGFTSAYLSGNTRLADVEMARARSEIASTARADLLARAELTRCAVRVASLEFDDCASYQNLAPDAGATEQAYAVYLSGRWRAADVSLLPQQHRAVASLLAANQAQIGNAFGNAAVPSLLSDMQDPLARLVAAGVLLQSQRLTPADLTVATQTASDQGWRRPLLAWLGVQLQRARAVGDAEAVSRIQRRVDLVLQAASKSQ
jgi:hypothetical protein